MNGLATGKKSREKEKVIVNNEKKWIPTWSHWSEEEEPEMINMKTVIFVRSAIDEHKRRKKTYNVNKLDKEVKSQPIFAEDDTNWHQSDIKMIGIKLSLPKTTTEEIIEHTSTMHSNTRTYSSTYSN